MSILLWNNEDLLTKEECERFYSMPLDEIVFSVDADDEPKRFLFCIWQSLNSKWGGIGKGIYRVLN